jgi:hypothetical protein
MTNPILRVPGDGDHLTLNEDGVTNTESFRASAVAAAGLTGDYWTFSTVDKSKGTNGLPSEKNYYVWYNVPNGGIAAQDPAVSGAIGIPVTVASSLSASGVAQATVDALRPIYNEIRFAVEAGTVSFLGVQRFAGSVPNVADGSSPTGFTFTTIQGSAGPDAEVEIRFTNRDVNGAIVSLEAATGSTLGYSDTTFTPKERELFGGWNLFDQTIVVASGLGIVRASAGAAAVKSDNRPLLGVS